MTVFPPSNRRHAPAWYHPQLVWTPAMDAALMQQVADGRTWGETGEALGVSRDVCSSRFARLAAAYDGWSVWYEAHPDERPWKGEVR